MIEQVFDEEKLWSGLKKPDLFSGKIKAIHKAYGFGYPFAKFYKQENGAVIGKYYDNAVVFSESDETDTEELKEFLEIVGYGEILMPYGLSEKLGFRDNVEKNLVFCYEDDEIMSDLCNKTVTLTESYDKIYKILSEGFDIGIDNWYTDINHNVRHCVSRVYTVPDKATATVMFSIDGISYLSYIATARSERNKGYGGKLLRYIIKKELADGNRPYLICKEELRKFYEKNGLRNVGYVSTIR